MGPRFGQQEQIEALLVEYPRAGKVVVRLKGGDPFVFGRGGEEALTLRAEGIPFEVVPGITAGMAAAAYAGIPVTHRGLSTSVALITGHTRADGAGAEAGEAGRGEAGDAERSVGDGEAGDAEGKQGGPGGEEEVTALDWSALAAFPGTLVFYMGVRQLPHIATSLIAAGRPPSEPAAIVERGTLPHQRTVTGTLATIAERARAESIRAPSITVVRASPDSPPARVARAAAAERAHGGCHPRARPNQQARPASARAGGRGGAGPGDPHPTAHGWGTDSNPAARPLPVRPDLPHQPQRRSPAVRAPRPIRSSSRRRAGAGRCTGSGDRPRHRARAGRARDHRRHRPRALRGRVAGGGARRASGPPRADRPRARGPRRAPRRPAGPRRPGGRAGALRNRRRAALPAGARRGTGGRLHHLHLILHRALLPGGRRRQRRGLVAGHAHRFDRPVTSATLREHDLEPDVEAADHDIDGLVAALLADAASRDE